MCVKYESCRTLTFYIVKVQRLSTFHYFVYKSMGSSPIGSPVDTSDILGHKSLNTYLIDLKVFVFERKQNYLHNDTKLFTTGD